MKNPIVIKEYEYLVKNQSKCLERIEENSDGFSFIDISSFEILKNFNYKNKDQIFFNTNYKYCDALQAKSFVGGIELKNGVFIEVLPKIYSGKEEDIENIKTIFLKMLSKLKNFPLKEFGFAHLFCKKYPLFEIFVLLFINKVNSLIKKGIRGDYINIIKNINFLKGKLIFNKDLKKNIAHKEKFYVSYDEFNINTHANRIIKTTIIYLLDKKISLPVQAKLRQLFFIFDSISESDNLEKDFQKAEAKMRLFKDYKDVLTFCKIFLRRETFVNYKGEQFAAAILFPMEKIFENYIAYLFKKHVKNYTVKIQAKEKSLLTIPQKFRLIPDIILEQENNKIIVDTKWKLIDSNKEKDNYNISQSDLYQMYAYAKKYKANKVVLLYPENDNFKEKFNEWKFENNISLQIVSFPLNKISENEFEFKKFFKKLFENKSIYDF